MYIVALSTLKSLYMNLMGVPRGSNFKNRNETNIFSARACMKAKNTKQSCSGVMWEGVKLNFMRIFIHRYESSQGFSSKEQKEHFLGEVFWKLKG